MKNNNDAGVVGLIILALLILLGIVMQPYFEARSFNKFSKIKATYWDAVWTQLRVMPSN